MKRSWRSAFVLAASVALLTGNLARAADKEDAKKVLDELQGFWTPHPSKAPAPEKGKSTGLALLPRSAFTVTGDKLAFLGAHVRMEARPTIAKPGQAKAEAKATDAKATEAKAPEHAAKRPHGPFTVHVDGSHDPKSIDLMPEGKDAQPIKGIYEIKDHVLRLGFDDGKERPADFKSAKTVMTYDSRATGVKKATKPTKKSN